MNKYVKIGLSILTVGVTITVVYHGGKWLYNKLNSGLTQKQADDIATKIEAAKTQHLSAEGLADIQKLKDKLIKAGYENDNGNAIKMGGMGQAEANSIAQRMREISFSKPGVPLTYGPVEQAEYKRLDEKLNAGGYMYISSSEESKAVKK